MHNNHALRALRLVVSGFLASGILVLLPQAVQTGSSVEGMGGKIRVVSLSPSNTEILFELGAQACLVGVSDACDFPREAKNLPQVGSFASFKVEKVAVARPDLVLLVNGQETAKAVLEKRKIPTLLLTNEKLADIGANVESIGQRVGKVDQARRVNEEFGAAVERLKAIVGKSTSRPQVLFCVWPQPLMAVGAKSFVHEAATVCGGVNVTGDSPAAYPVVSLETLLRKKPEVVVLPFEAKTQSFWKSRAWQTLPAVKNNRVYFLPPADRDPLLRPTVRILEGLRWLAERLHPELKPELDRWWVDSSKALEAHGVPQKLLRSFADKKVM